MLWVSRRAGRTDRTRAAALMWGGWLLVTGLVFSYMSGISHPYYTVALAPAIGALVGIGGAGLWRIRHTRFARVALAAALALTGGWAWVLLDRTPGWLPWLRVVIVIAAVAAAGLIVAGPALRAATVRGRTALAAAGVAGAGGRAGLPAGLQHRHRVDRARRVYPVRWPHGRGRRGRTRRWRRARPWRVPWRARRHEHVRSAVINLLKAGAPGYRWVAATVGSTSAAALELSTGGRPVMAIGGFSGSDPAPSLAEFEKLVAEHKIHYFIGGGSGGSAGGSGDSSQITSWVRTHFTARTVGGMTVYDLTALAHDRRLRSDGWIGRRFLRRDCPVT